MTIRKIFEHHCGDLKIDEKLAKSIIRYDVNFVTKNNEHVSFFGSALLGVHPVRFIDDDRHRWMDDILDVDEILIKDDVDKFFDSMKNHPSELDKVGMVGRDVFNLSCVFLCHKFHKSNLPTKIKNEALTSILLILHYRLASSILAHFYPYPADPAIAKATYNALSKKFDIKVLGSWSKLFRKRCEDILSNTGIHKDTMKYMREDKAIVYVITDIQTRIRNSIKAQATIFYRIRDGGGKIISTSSMMETDDGLMVKDTKRDINQYTAYAHEVIPDSRNFIRRELLDVIMEVNPSANPALVNSSLVYISDQFDNRKNKYIRETMDACLLYSLNFIRTQRINTSDLKVVLFRLKSMLTGARVNDATVLMLRKNGDKIVQAVLPKNTTAPVSPDRTAVLLYVIMRTLTKNHYSR